MGVVEDLRVGADEPSIKIARKFAVVPMDGSVREGKREVERECRARIDSALKRTQHVAVRMNHRNRHRDGVRTDVRRRT